MAIGQRGKFTRFFVVADKLMLELYQSPEESLSTFPIVGAGKEGWAGRVSMESHKITFFKNRYMTPGQEIGPFSPSRAFGRPVFHLPGLHAPLALTWDPKQVVWGFLGEERWGRRRPASHQNYLFAELDVKFTPSFPEPN